MVLKKNILIGAILILLSLSMVIFIEDDNDGLSFLSGVMMAMGVAYVLKWLPWKFKK